MSQNYKLTLVNVWWTESGIDTRFFDSISDQKTYFDDLMEGVSTPFVNFQMENNINTRVTYKENSARSVEDLMKCNYCVVRKFNADKEEIARRYFFAYPRKQDSQGQIIVDLSLDDLQTNYFQYKSTISPCKILRSHLDRWVHSQGDTVSFDGTINSKLFEREQITDVAKRLTRRTKLNFKVSDNETVNEWYNSHIWGWVYIFIDDKNYNVYNQGVTPGAMTEVSFLHQTFGYVNNGSGDCYLHSTLPILCFPLYKQNGGRLILKRYGGAMLWLDNNGFDYFKQNNDQNSYIKSIKFSVCPPCYFPSNNFEISNGHLIYDTNSTGISYSIGDMIGYRFDSAGTSGLLNVFNITKRNEFELTYTCLKDLTFYKSIIKNGTKNPSYNPKLLNSDYFELKLTNERGNGFSYDFQKLNNNNITLLYSEALTPDITRSYLRIKQPNGIYIEDTDKNLTGLVDSADMSLMVDNDQLSQMLANNKNFYLQNYLNIGEKALMGGIGGAIAGGGVGALVSAGVNAGMSLINGTLSIDNMRNAPKDLKNANGNAYFNVMYCEPGLYIEEYEILENEKKIINDTMFMNGFTTNLIGNVSDYDNIRKVFNYLSAEVETITAPISNDEKERLKQKLLNIRFWNTDNIDYNNTKNYERWLDNE